MSNPHDGDVMQEIQYYIIQLSDLWEEKFAVSLSIGTLATVFGIDAAMLMCISLLMIADLVLGILCAWIAHELSFAKLQRGAMKFLAYYLSMLLVNIVNDWTSRSLGIRLPVQNLYVTYLIATEATSIMIHCNSLGMPFPPLFRIILKNYQSKIETTVESLTKSSPKDEHHEQ